MWDEILISTAAVLVVMFLLYGLKKVVCRVSLKTKTANGDIESKESRFTGFFINIYGTKKKILSVVIFAVLILIFYLLFRNIIFSLLVSVCLEIYILDIFKGFEEKRKELLHNQLIEFISHMSVLLRAGKTVRGIFKDSARWFKNPLRAHLNKVANELKLNSTLDEALDRFSEECKSREVDLLTSSLKINNKIGGDLIAVLDSITDRIRHSLKIKSQMRTMSLQGRYSGNIISLFPVIVLILLSIFVNREILGFFSTGLGTILLIAGGILEIAGIIVIKKLLA